MSSIGYTSRKDEAAERAAEKAAERYRDLANALFESEEFRTWLDGVADEARLLSASAETFPYPLGRRDALRDLVTKLVTTAARGPQWLAAYADSKKISTQKETDGK